MLSIDYLLSHEVQLCSSSLFIDIQRDCEKIDSCHDVNKPGDVTLKLKSELMVHATDDHAYEVQDLNLWIEDEVEPTRLWIKDVHELNDNVPVYETIPHIVEEASSEDTSPTTSNNNIDHYYSISNVIDFCKSRLTNSFSKNFKGYSEDIVVEVRRKFKRRLSSRAAGFGILAKSKEQIKTVRDESTFYINLKQNEQSIRKSSRRNRRKSNIVRPKEAPPDPPKCDSNSTSSLPDSEEALNRIEEVYCSYLFATEPLYHQFYDEVGTKRESSSSTMELLLLEGYSCKRTLWSELPEVQRHYMEDLSTDDIKYQEALFEVITSEASYLKSLNVFISHFVSCKELVGDFGGSLSNGSSDGLLTKRECQILFSDISHIRSISEKFFFNLENQWQRSSPFLDDILPIIQSYAEVDFKSYVKYTANQIYQDRLLSHKLSTDEQFKNLIKQLESSPLLESLSFHSFLLLPMQRITRYPLLLSAILKHIPPGDESRIAVGQSALKKMNSLVHECNESARHMERMEEMLKLSHQFNFVDQRCIPLLSPGRWLVRKTKVVRLLSSQDGKQTLSDRFKSKPQTLKLYLFTDLLVIVKQKSEDHFKVLDHCPRNLLCISDTTPDDAIDESTTTLTTPLFNNSKTANDCLSWLTLLQNYESKTREYLISFESIQERSTWNKLIDPPSEAVNWDDEQIYESWDCPVIVAQSDIRSGSLFLSKGCKADVLRKAGDSLFVQSILDKTSGWISANLVEEVESNHVRARHLRQRYKFLKLVSTDS